MGEAIGETQAQSDEDSTVLQKGGTQAWLVGVGGAGHLAQDLASLWPPPARHGWPVIERPLQATQNGSW